MGMWTRLKLIFSTKASSAMDRAEGPRQGIDYAYTQQELLLVKPGQGLVEVATWKQQLERPSKKLEGRVPQLEDQAKRALGAGRDDLARIALERKRSAAVEIEGLSAQIAEVGAEEKRLAGQERSLQVRIEEFRTPRDVVSARHSASEAEVKVKEALSGVSGELAELGMAVGRAEEKADRLQSRAKALDSLVDIGALEPVAGGDYVDTELKPKTSGARNDDKSERLTTHACAPSVP